MRQQNNEAKTDPIEITLYKYNTVFHQIGHRR